MQKPIQRIPLSLPRFINALRCVFLILLIAGLQTTVHAAKILYVQNLTQRDTVKLINILKAQGHDVTVWTTASAGNVSTADTYASQGFQLLIVDESIGSGSVGASFSNSPIPVINWEGFLYSDGRSPYNISSGTVGGTFNDAASAQAANGGNGADYGQVISETNINVILPSHPLAAGMPAGLNAVFDPNPPTIVDEGAGVISFIGTRTLIPGATVVATVPGFAGGGSIVGIDAGVLNYGGGSTNKARWVHLPWNDTDQQERVMIEPSYFIFEAAVAWALGSNQPTKIYNLLPVSGGFQPTNEVVTFQVDKTNNAGSSVTTGNITLKINGLTVVPIITDGGARWNVSFTTNLPKNQSYTIIASAKALDGGFSARMSVIDTFDANNYSFEAEDFNFDGGKYFTNIVLCSNSYDATPSDNCYFNRVGATNIDQFEVNFTTASAPLTNEVYRYGLVVLPDITRKEYVDTFVTSDTLLRQKYITAGLSDYEVRNVTNNEWLNYTRSYPTGYYNIYMRASSANPVNVQMDFVNGDITTTNQIATNKLGRFVRANGTSGYETIPLTDDSGSTPLTVQIIDNSNPTATNVVKTIRVTALSAGFNPNFYMLVPTTAPPNQQPSITSATPTNGSVLTEGVTFTFSVGATDPDGTITNVEFRAGIVGGVTNLIGNDTTAPFSMAYTPTNYGMLNYYNVQITARDNGGLPATTNFVVKIVSPGLKILTTASGNGADSELTENDGGDTGNGTKDNMNVRIQQATGTTNRHEVIAMRFDLGADNPANIGSVTLNMVPHRALAARPLHVWGVTNGTVGLDNGTNGVFGYTDNNWVETNCTFANMPGLIWDGQEETKGLTNVMDLGVLNVGKQKAEVWTFKTGQLLSFLRHNPDNIVTFLIEVDQDNTGQSRFSTKEAVAQDTGVPLAPTGSQNWWAPFLSYTLGAPSLNMVQTGNTIRFSWVGNFKLQSQTNSLSAGLTGTWSDYPGGANGPINITINPANPTVFYRLSSP
jgi:Bacterial Ig domain